MYNKETENDATLQDHRWIDQHLQQMWETSRRLLGFSDGISPDAVLSDLPLIETEVDETLPGCCHMAILCRQFDEDVLLDFISQTIRTQLIPGKIVHPISFEYFSFYINAPTEENLFLVQLKVLLKTDFDQEQLQSQIGATVQLLKDGLNHPKHIPTLIEYFSHSHDNYSIPLCHLLIHLEKRWPQVKLETLFQEMKLLTAKASRPFFKHRNNTHLLRIISSLVALRNEIENSEHFLFNRRCLSVRIFPATVKYLFGDKKTLAVCVMVNNLDQYELFQERHVMQAIRSMVPDAQFVKESKLSYEHADDNSRALYLEVEKSKGGFFTFKEISKLKKSLPYVLDSNIERVMPQVLTVRNEEEILKNILRLCQELQSPQDPPQVIVTFHSQTISHLYFTVTLVRLCNQQAPSLRQSLQKADERWDISFEREDFYQDSQNGLHKQGYVILLGLRKSREFIRTDSSVNLYKAYQTVSEFLTQHIGSVREYTGGLILQQNASFSRLKNHFTDFYREYPYVLEDFIYGIHPVESQVILPFSTLRQLFETFLVVFYSSNKEGGKYVLKKDLSSDHAYVVIQLPPAVDASILQDEIEHVCGCRVIQNKIVHRGYTYISYLYPLNQSQDHERFFACIEKGLYRCAKDDPYFQTLRLNFNAYPNTFDPRIGLETRTVHCLRLLFEGLMRMGEEDKPEYALAQSHDISDDKRVYTFHLRKSCWNNGDPVTAHDFAYAWKQIISPRYSTPSCYLFSCIHNAQKVMSGELSEEDLGIEVIDDYTLQVILEHPISHFLELLTVSIFFPVNKRVDQEFPDWPTRTREEYVCNGPFQLVETTPGKTVSFSRNPHYWDKEHVHLKEIKVITSDKEIGWKMYREKKSDWIGKPFNEFDRTMKEIVNPRSIHQSDHDLIYSLYLNTKHPLLSKTKFRQALSHAIDREQLISILPIDAAPTHHPMARDRCAVGENKALYNPELAQQYLNEVLEEMDMSILDIPKIRVLFGLEFTFLFSDALHFIQKQLNEVLGVPISIELYPWARAYSKIRQSDFDIFFAGWMNLISSPYYFLDTMRDHNFMQWKSDHFSQTLTQSYHAQSKEQLEHYMQELEQILIDQAPLIPLFYELHPYLVNEKLSGVKGSKCGCLDFKSAHFDWSPTDVRQRISWL